MHPGDHDLVPTIEACATFPEARAGTLLQPPLITLPPLRASLSTPPARPPTHHPPSLPLHRTLCTPPETPLLTTHPAQPLPHPRFPRPPMRQALRHGLHVYHAPVQPAVPHASPRDVLQYPAPTFSHAFPTTMPQVIRSHAPASEPHAQADVLSPPGCHTSVHAPTRYNPHVAGEHTPAPYPLAEARPAAPVQRPVHQPSTARLMPTRTPGAPQGSPRAQDLPAGASASPAPRDAAVEQYWRRLSSLLSSARSFARELQPDRAGLPRPVETPRRIAYDLQGLTARAAGALLATQPRDYRAAFQSRAAGDFIEYGVSSAHAVWAARVLSAVVGSPPPAACTPDIPLVGTTEDPAVEDVRLRVFEAEVACLPVEVVEALLKRRRSMHRFKHRIELCVRILLALEGRGRRPTQASLDRLKLQLEKADIQARAEAERAAARKERERQKLERERQKHERVKKNLGVKADDKKRRRQQSAQANFMKRFVKKDDKDTVDEEVVVMQETAREGFAAPLATDRDVMSVAWWLRAEMSAPPLDQLDVSLVGGQEILLSDLAEHLAQCAKRRELAERRIHIALREYRGLRKMHTENRTPMFSSRRADVRGRGVTGPVKLLQFAENYRPAYFGTFGQRSRSVSGRCPFGKDKELDYECDSADEWDEDEEGEDLLDVEADKELASEEAELRRLYGSDDEDDDDFLDDGDVEDDDDEDGNRDDDENGTASGPASQEIASPLKGNASGSEVIDLTLTTVNESKGKQIQKRPAKDETRKRGGKRRKGMLKQSVVIYNVSIPDGEPSPLDRFAVDTFEGSQPIQMFNPFVYTSYDIDAEHLKAKPPSLRAARASNMDESTKLDLAAALMRTGSTKDKIVLQFCEHRKMRGLAVPTKAEIMRAIGEIATKEKREGDTRALWHLKDQSIARKMAQMNNPAPTALPHVSASVVVD